MMIPASARIQAEALMCLEIEVGPPLVSGGLAVYPLRLGRPSTGPRMMSLPEAMEAGLVVVHETGRVDEVLLELDGELPVLGLAGDLLRGGRQDRVLQHDVVAVPRAGRVGAATFCVEAGRWQQRGQESAATFSVTRAAPSSLRCMLALGADQRAVWAQVSAFQERN